MTILSALDVYILPHAKLKSLFSAAPLRSRDIRHKGRNGMENVRLCQFVHSIFRFFVDPRCNAVDQTRAARARSRSAPPQSSTIAGPKPHIVWFRPRGLILGFAEKLKSPRGPYIASYTRTASFSTISNLNFNR